MNTRLRGAIVATIATVLAHAICYANGYWTYSGEDRNADAMCKAITKELNKYAKYEKPTNHCSWSVISTYKEFSRPDWKDVDITEHKDLLPKLFKYGQEGRDGYFRLIPGLKTLQPDEVYALHAEEFVRDGGRMQVYKANKANYLGNEISKINPILLDGEQTFVRLVYKKDQSSKAVKEQDKCRTDRFHVERKGVYLVDESLTGPLLSTNAGLANFLSSGALVIYDGRILLLTDEMIIGSHAGVMDLLCNFHFHEGEK